MITKQDLHRTALIAVANGISVVPTVGKLPAEHIAWKTYQQRRATPDELQDWFANKGYNIAVIGGTISGNLEILDIEGRAMEAGKWQELIQLANETGMAEVFTKLLEGYVEYTPSGGLHILYRVETPVHGNLKLARDPGLAAKDDPGKDVVIETRGEGGYAVVAPSGGGQWSIDDSVKAGTLANLATITTDEYEAFHDLCRMLDRQIVDEPQQRNDPKPRADNDETPGDIYNREETWDALLTKHGWTKLRNRGEIQYWRRPGKRLGVSATVGATPSKNRLVVHSTSTKFETSPRSYDLFGAYVILEHAGNFSNAARHLREHYRSIPSNRPRITPAASRAADAIDAVADGTGTGERNVDGADGTDEPAPDPSRLDRWHTNQKRGNEIRMIPALPYLVEGLIDQGTLTMIYGAPKNGKSFVALDIAAHIALGWQWREMATVKSPVLYVLEEGVGDISKRYIAWCAHHEIADVDDFIILPEAVQLGNDEHLGDLIALIQTEPVPPKLVIIDTLARSMTGVEENSAKEVGPIIHNAGIIIRQTGASVMLVHHSGKDETKGSRGSSAILAAVDTELRIIREDDKIEMSVTAQRALPMADKPLRWEMLQLHGSVVIEPTENDADDIMATAETNRAIENAIVQIAQLLEDNPWEWTVRQIKEHIKLRKTTFDSALKTLEQNGYVTKTLKQDRTHAAIYQHQNHYQPT